MQERCEFGLVARAEFNANGTAEVRGGGNHGVNGLLDIFFVEFGDQRGLNGCATGGQLGGVDCTGGSRRSEDIGLLGEDVADQLSDLRGVRSTTREDYLKFGCLISVCIYRSSVEIQTSSMSRTSNSAFLTTCSIRLVNWPNTLPARSS